MGRMALYVAGGGALETLGSSAIGLNFRHVLNFAID